jgi:thiamine-monophosphate kinase
VISISLTGFVERGRWVGRAGGKAGDELFVTGRLGGSLRGHHLKFIPRIAESRWLAENFRIHAMMDLSDGLGADLPRLARASGVGFEVDEAALPLNRGCTIRQAISDGEDCEGIALIALSLAEKVSESSTHQNWPAKSKIENPKSKIPRRLSSFQIAQRRRGEAPNDKLLA